MSKAPILEYKHYLNSGGTKMPTLKEQAAVVDILEGNASFRQAAEVLGSSHQHIYQVFFRVLREWYKSSDTIQSDIAERKDKIAQGIEADD